MSEEKTATQVLYEQNAEVSRLRAQQDMCIRHAEMIVHELARFIPDECRRGAVEALSGMFWLNEVEITAKSDRLRAKQEADRYTQMIKLINTQS